MQTHQIRFLDLDPNPDPARNPELGNTSPNPNHFHAMQAPYQRTTLMFQRMQSPLSNFLTLILSFCSSSKYPTGAAGIMNLLTVDLSLSSRCVSGTCDIVYGLRGLSLQKSRPASKWCGHRLTHFRCLTNQPNLASNVESASCASVEQERSCAVHRLGPCSRAPHYIALSRLGQKLHHTHLSSLIHTELLPKPWIGQCFIGVNF